MASTFNCPSCGAPLDYPGSGDTMHCPYCHESVIVPQDLRHPAGGVSQIAAVTRLVQSGQKIEAIKLYRQMTGASLVEAKAAVDALESANPQLAAAGAGGTGFRAVGLSSEQTALIQRLCAGGQKIEAIKLYRQVTQVGLAEAKAAVEALAVGSPLPYPAGPAAKKKSFSLGAFGFGLLLLAVASIFPIVFIPMGISSVQQGDIGGAIGSFIGAGVWALVWGAIGVILVISSFG